MLDSLVINSLASFGRIEERVANSTPINMANEKVNRSRAGKKYPIGWSGMVRDGEGRSPAALQPCTGREALLWKAGRVGAQKREIHAKSG